MPRNEVVKKLKEELKKAGVTEKLGKPDIGKALQKYKEGKPNEEYVRKLRSPPPIDYSKHPLDQTIEEVFEEEAEDEEEPVSEEEIQDPDYYPGLEEEEPIDTIEPPPPQEPGKYEGDELPDLPPIRLLEDD
jgi:hypothetical protein